MKKTAILAVTLCGAVAAFAAHSLLVSLAAAALTLPCAAASVVVSPGFDFTNVTVRVSGAPGAQFSITDSANAPVASGAVPASAHTCEINKLGPQ